MSCLGERLTALVDGELGHAERDRVLAHLAGCDRCRDEVASMRSLKGRLRGLSGMPAPDGADDLPSPDLLSRLRSLPASPGLAGPAETPPAGPPGPVAPPRPARPPRSPARPVRAAHPRDTRPVGRAAVHVQQRRYLMLGVATVFLGLGAASYAAGGRQDTPTVTPAFDRFAVEHALTSGDVPMTDPLTDPLNHVQQVSPGP